MSASHDFIRFLKTNKVFLASLFLLVFCLILSFLVSFFAPFDPRRWNTVPSRKPPSLTHPFGTTILGQDVFWLLTWSLRNSIIIGFLGSIVGLTIGVILGLIAGYKGGILDKFILAIADVFFTIPNIMIIILVASILRGQLSIYFIGVLIGLLTWSMPVRNIRPMVLSLRERIYTNSNNYANLE